MLSAHLCEVERQRFQYCKVWYVKNKKQTKKNTKRITVYHNTITISLRCGHTVDLLVNIAIPSRVKWLTFRVAPAALKNATEIISSSVLWLGTHFLFLLWCGKSTSFNVVQTLTAASPHRCLCPAPLVLLWLWVGPAEGAGAVVSASVVVTRVGKWNGGLERGDGLVAVQAVLGAAVSRVFNWGEGQSQVSATLSLGSFRVCR